jgi:deazaflavin-dependent oxidoreductase (nitroreductase family)
MAVDAWDGEYAPSPERRVRDQVDLYERTGGKEGNLLAGTSWPVVIFTTRGNKSGKIRKFPLMRVEHDGRYAMVASMGGAPKHPVWYYNVTADPDAIAVQDGDRVIHGRARELSGEERETWWRRAVEAYPPYAEYQTRTDRVIPVILVEPAS